MGKPRTAGRQTLTQAKAVPSSLTSTSGGFKAKNRRELLAGLRKLRAPKAFRVLGFGLSVRLNEAPSLEE